MFRYDFILMFLKHKFVYKKVKNIIKNDFEKYTY